MILAATARSRLDGWSWLSLFVVLVLFPVVWCVAPVGDLVRGIFAGDRTSWWLFHACLLVVHWVPFALIAWTLHRNREPWSSIGVDWSWFWRYWYCFLPLLAVLVVGAFVLPGMHYVDTFPSRSQSHFMAPVSTVERLFMILIAITAGVTEEVLFRGFPFTRLGRILPSPWLVLPITVVSFLFIHGVPRNNAMLAAYLGAGLAFGVPFILMKLRRLEVLILIHFLIDAGMVLGAVDLLASPMIGEKGEEMAQMTASLADSKDLHLLFTLMDQGIAISSD